MIPAAFDVFLKQAPFCVLARSILERLYEPNHLDELFKKSASQQYERELLFSQVVELMTSVVLRVHPSVHAAFLKRASVLPVTDQAVYDKLQNMEINVSAALVADSAAQVAPVVEALKARLRAWLAGYRVRIIDGNHLSATEKRIKELRRTWAAALPGKVLAVYEQELDLVTSVFLTPDGHEQERALLEGVLPSVQAKDLWIADRNFCTLRFLFGIHQRQAAFIIRQHGQLTGELLGERRPAGKSDSGQVFEQTLVLEYNGERVAVRRITVELDKPTRDGQKELHILTNLPEADADAVTVANIYRKRWTIEHRFYEVTQTLNCEPNTLGYPKAALFAFCLALAASNAVALLKASLRAVHEAEKVEQLSSYYAALEIKETYVGMMIALSPEQWHWLRSLSIESWAETLRKIASHVDLDKYRKAKRGPKKPPTKKDRYQNGGHVSTHRLLQTRKTQPGTGKT
jgi:IS4 transposase